MSLLDHFTPNVYVPFIFFYEANKASNISKTSQLLKQSLSKTLSLYYPLAGKANDNLSIHCDDQGACYAVASANCCLSDYLKQPILSTLLKFLPDVALTVLAPGDHVLRVQETVFSCGGIAIGFLYTHTVFDGGALGAFIKTWATIARESITEGADLSPNFSASSIFPQISTESPLDLTFLNSILSRKGEFVVRRFGFDGSVISNLKAKAASSGVQKPTRVEVVSAVLYKCIMSALEAKSGTKKSALVTNGVNLRRKAVPPFSDNWVGNFVWLVAMETQAEDKELCKFVHRMREALSPINGEFVKSLQGEGGKETFCAYWKGRQESFSKALAKGVEPIGFNSWCNAGLFDADYGWGKPLWVPVVTFAIASPQIFIQLTDTRHGNGVEAWVVLDVEAMSLLEHDKELLSLASVDPIVLCLPNGIEAWVVLEEEIMTLVEHDKELISLASLYPSHLQISSVRSNLLSTMPSVVVY
ncbi:stemmadenine O-acetyltransferase-like [Tripterygium wilfordii]|uniref:stemmadenine O-acetyltransferase-like n=1 Tax=Tripterygium wilfordii TaxID=458696 RepID=UPI0018F82ABC|nr:stemmadenine O-acetyltransferase-like [Tripterygium wilfordii]